IKSGDYKDIGANYKSINSNESKMLQTIVDNDADRFKSNVAANRNMSKSEIDKIADGSVFDGQQAKDNKLVDNVGSRKDAIELAVKLGGLPSTYDTETYSTDNTFYLGLTSQTNIVNTLNRLIFK
ncbi:MAG: S49 family peptidase, partial [Methanobrevibacter sp.]